MNTWDDLRFFLAVARAGSLAGASRALRVDATTVGRRVAALEETLGTSLFLRRRDRWGLTPAGERVLPLAERAEATAAEVRTAAAAQAEEVEGRVRVTLLDEIASRVVVPHLEALMARWPDLRIDLLCTTRRLDLRRGEADLALRLGRPTESELVARRVAVVRERPCASETWLARRGLDAASVRHLDGCEVVLLLTGARERWTEGLGRVRPVLRSTSPEVTYAAIARGIGVGMVPDLFVADGMVPLPGLGVVRETSLWMCALSGALEVPAVRVVADHLAAVLAAPG